MKKHYLLLASVLCLLVLPLTLTAQNWTQFRGMNRDGKTSGFKAPASWPAELTQVWKVKAGTGDATPVLSGKRIYLNTRQEGDEVILCLDAASGKSIWSVKYPVAPATGPAGSHPGPRSTPVISEGKLVTFGISGIISCVDASTGKLLWRKENPTNAIPQFYTGMSPLVVDGMCIAQVGTKDNGSVIALDMKTGQEKWKFQGEGPAYASPSVMTIGKVKLLVLFTEKSLMSLTLNDGKLAWQLPAPAQQRFYNCVSPYIDGSRIYFSGQGTGTKALEVSMLGNQFVTKELWSNPAVGAKWNTPVLKNGFLYGFSDQKKIYCLNASTGETAWIDVTASSDFATIVDCETVLTGLPSTGNLIIFKADPKGYGEIAKYKLSETPVYSYPIVAGNKVYIKDAESLTMYIIK